MLPMFTDPKKGKKRIKVGEKKVGKKRWEKRKGERERDGKQISIPNHLNKLRYFESDAKILTARRLKSLY